MISEFAQSFGTGNTYSNRNTGALVDLGPDPSSQCLKVTWYAAQIGKGLVDAVDLDCRHKRLDHGHHALTHVTVERVI
ncbi:hypothetical protein D9M71_718560 [compost metagenome]